jgi:hypothetical protein
VIHCAHSLKILNEYFEGKIIKRHHEGKNQKNKTITTFDEPHDKRYGKIGTAKRTEFEMKPSISIRFRDESAKHNKIRPSRKILRGRNSQIISTIKIEERPYFAEICRCSRNLKLILG